MLVSAAWPGPQQLMLGPGPIAGALRAPESCGQGILHPLTSSVDPSKPPVRRSRFRGLTWDKKEKRWRVRINVMGKQHHVGRYYSEVEGARAFDRAALCIYGEMAITNFGLDAARADPSPVSAHILMVKREYERFKLVQLQQQALLPQVVGGAQPLQQQPMPQQQDQQHMMMPSAALPFSSNALQYQLVQGPPANMGGLVAPGHPHESVLPPFQQQQQQHMLQVAGGSVDLASNAGFASSGAPNVLQPPTPYASMAPLSTGNQLAAKLQALGLEGHNPGQGMAQQGYGGPLGGTTMGMLIPAGLQPVSLGPVAGAPPAWLPVASYACATSIAPSSSSALAYMEGPGGAVAAAPVPVSMAGGCMAMPGDGSYGASAGGGVPAPAPGADPGIAGGAEGGASAQALANLLLAVRDRGMLTTHTTIGDLLGMLQQQA